MEKLNILKIILETHTQADEVIEYENHNRSYTKLHFIHRKRSEELKMFEWPSPGIYELCKRINVVIKEETL